MMETVANTTAGIRPMALIDGLSPTTNQLTNTQPNFHNRRWSLTTYL
jgi:hypothetical protein